MARDTAILGSIGVVTTIRDAREREAKAGVKSIDIVSSRAPKKRLDPMEDTGRAELQTMLDGLEDVFVVAVAQHRGVDVDTVVAQFGQGGVLVGQAAVAAGLADRLGSYEAVHAELAEQVATGVARGARPPGHAAPPTAPPFAADASPARSTSPASLPRSSPLASESPMNRPTNPPTPPDPAAGAAPPAPAAAAAPAPASAPAATLTPEQLAAQHPEAAAQLRTAAATAERERILAIDALDMPGHAAVIARCKADPTCAPGQAALLLLAAEKSAKGQHLAGLRGDEAGITAPTPATPGATDTTSEDAIARAILGAGGRPADPSRN